MLDNKTTQSSKFRTKKWIKITECKTTMLNLNLNLFILVKEQYGGAIADDKSLNNYLSKPVHHQSLLSASAKQLIPK